MLLFDRDLREAYLLKEVFYQFMASTSSAQAKQKLLEFRLHATVGIYRSNSIAESSSVPNSV